MRNLQLTGLAIVTLAVQTTFAKDGWIDLFNGKDLSGWTQKTGNARYFVQDGCIVGEMHVPGGGTNSFLCTTKDYDNFILELDFNADPRVNTGVQIRSQYADKPVSVEWQGKTINIGAGYVYGYQVEVDTNLKGKAWTGGIYDERRRRGYIDPDAAHGKAFTALNRQITITNGWNHLRIEAVGDSMKTYFNGVLRANIKDSLTPRGFFGLQVHNSNEEGADGAQIRFKNIRLKPVKPTPPRPEPAPNALTDAEKKNGWRLLWDGKTTEGWRSAKSDAFPTEGWMIDGGQLTVTNDSGAESAGGGDIITRERFTNFEFVVDFKTTPGCNSGIKYFVQPNLDPITGAGTKASVGSAIGYEYQILDDARHPDAKLGRNGDRQLGALYDLLPVDGDKRVNPIGEWNTARILVRGDRVEHWLNGRRILKYNRNSRAFKEAYAQSKFRNIAGYPTWPDGHILLQEHGSPVSFRSVKIRVLPAK